MDFDIRLTPESQKILENLARAGKIDLRPTLNIIGKGYRKEVAMIFGHQQPRGDGMKWPQLSEKYAEWKEKHFPGKPLLVRTGTLRSSMTEENAQGGINLIGKSSAVFGSSIRYGVYHDSNEPRKSNLPRRNFSEPSERRLKIWEQQLRDDIVHNFEVNGIQVKGDVIA
jgi:phage gpG-like protein